MSFPVRSTLSLRLRRLTISLLVFAMGVLLLPSQGRAQCSTNANVTTCTGSGITVSSTLNASVGSSISVSGVSGTVTSISVTFNSLNVTGGGGYQSIAMALVQPNTGTALDLFSGVCNAGNSTFTLADTGFNGTDRVDNLAPYLGSGATCPGALSGTYLPSDWFPGADTFASPGPGTSYDSGGAGNACEDVSGGPCGTNDFTTTFGLPTASNMNGTWTLYIANQASPVGTGSLGSWSISFTTETATGTTTAINASPNGSSSVVFTNRDVNNDSTTGTPVTLTATVSPTPDGGTVTFYDSTGTTPGSGTPLVSGVPVSSGQAQTPFTFTSEGPRTISAVYSGDSSFATSTSPDATVVTTNHPYNPSGNTFCNGPITINNNPTDSANDGAAYPYPSMMALGANALSGTIESVTVSLNDINLGTYTNLYDLGFLLRAPGSDTSGVAPNGNAFEFLSYAGNPYRGGSLTLSDTGSAEIPYDSAPSCSTCLPTDDWSDVGAADDIDTFPVPAPTSFDKAAPTGSSTFASEFGGQGANNTWILYAADRIPATPPLGSVGEWCLNFTMQVGANPTTTTVSGNPNPATITSGTTANVNLTATVTSTGGTVNAGTVTFDDGSTELGSAPVVNGAASLSSVALTEGTHQITASYGGTNTGTVFGISNGKFDERVDKKTSISGTSPTYSYCNSGAITAPGLMEDAGAAYPYPSNIFVSNLPGTVKATTITLNGFNTKDQGDLMSLVVGPSTDTNQWNNNFDFFSLTGSSVGVPATSNLTFADGGASIGGNNLENSGTYAPESNEDLKFPQCGQNAPDCGTENVGPPLGTSSTFTPSNLASPKGSAILGNANAEGVFGGTTSSTYNGNGTWSLYLDDGGPAGGGEDTNVTQGWCVNLTVNTVTVTPALSHNGTGMSGDFLQGEQGGSVIVNVENNGVGPTGDPTGTNPLKVTDTLNAALTFDTSITSYGSGWTCSASSQTVTCTNDSAVAQGNSYPQLTIPVNVATTSGTSIPNSINVSGAGITANSANDTITVIQVPATVTISGGNNQSATVNTSFTNPLLVTVYDAANVVIANQSVSFTAPASGASGAFSNSTDAITANTNGSGQLSEAFTANTVAGAYTVTAMAGTVSNTFNLTNTAGNPASIMSASGTPQSTTVATTFSQALVAKVADQYGNPVSGASVTFTAPGSGASGVFSNSSFTITGSTNSSGQLSESFTANTVAGADNVTASVSGVGTSATFGLTNLAGVATSISAVSGGGQSTADTTAFASPLVALVTDQYGNPVAGASVTFTPPVSGPSVTFAGGVNTAISAANGDATSAAMAANSQVGGPYTVVANLAAATANFQLTNTVGAFSQLAVSTPSPAYVGVPSPFTVTAEDAGGNLVATVNDTMHFTSSDPSASLPPDSPLVNGTGTFTVTMATTGTQSVTATDVTTVVSGTSSNFVVQNVPLLIVTTNQDDSGDATQCTIQASGPTGTDAACSLRDALLESGTLGAASITFDSTKVSGANSTITLSNGVLTIPTYTTINGGGVVTVNGNGASGVFQITNTSAVVSINGLAVSNGLLSSSAVNATEEGAGLYNNASSGSLTITNSTFSNNSVVASDPSGTAGGGAIFNNGAMTVSNSTFNGNSASSGGNVSGGAIYDAHSMHATNITVTNNSATNTSANGIASGGGILGGADTITGSTISGNFANSSAGAGLATGGGIFASGQTTISYSTITGNSAIAAGSVSEGGGIFPVSLLKLNNTTVTGNSATDGGGIFVQGSLTLANTILSGNSASTNPDLDPQSSTVTNNGGNVISSSSTDLAPLSNNGGATETMIPLPGSAAICAGVVGNIPGGITTDQRGLPNTNATYPGFTSGTACVDAGSVQTNYSISFSTEPSPITPATMIGANQLFTAAVTLDESGSPMGAASVSIPLTLTGTGILSGGLATTTGGVATYSSLKITAGDPNDVLNASLLLNGTLTKALELTTPSSAFAVGGPMYGHLDVAYDSTTKATIVPKTDSLMVGGWALDVQSAVSKVEVLIDGNVVGNATLGVARPDIAAAFNNSAYLDSGWNLTVAASSLTVGPHTVTAMAFDSANNPTTLVSPLSFTVSAAATQNPPLGHVDQAMDSTTRSSTVAQTDTLLITGWAADPQQGAPVTKVQVLIDGATVGSATLGLQRPDVEAAYSKPNYLNSGWTFSYAASSLSLGSHTVSAVAIDSLGLTTRLNSMGIVVATSSNALPVGFVDKAVDATTGQTTVSPSDNLLVSGWAVDPQANAPATAVRILIDGNVVGLATLGIARPDVEKAYNDSNYLDSGWSFTYAASSLTTGSHTVTAVAYDTLGLSKTVGTKTITVP